MNIHNCFLFCAHDAKPTIFSRIKSLNMEQIHYSTHHKSRGQQRQISTKLDTNSVSFFVQDFYKKNKTKLIHPIRTVKFRCWTSSSVAGSSFKWKSLTICPDIDLGHEIRCTDVQPLNETAFETEQGAPVSFVLQAAGGRPSGRCAEHSKTPDLELLWPTRILRDLHHPSTWRTQEKTAFWGRLLVSTPSPFDCPEMLPSSLL